MKQEIWTFLLLWSIKLTTGADVSVTCARSTDCVLPCTSDYHDIIHWYKDGKQDSVHTFYDNADHLRYQDVDFKGRTSLFTDQIPQGNASLLLRTIRIEDEGRYKCYTATVSHNREQFVLLKVKEDRHTGIGVGVGVGVVTVICIIGTILYCRRSKGAQGNGNGAASGTSRLTTDRQKRTTDSTSGVLKSDDIFLIKSSAKDDHDVDGTSQDETGDDSEPLNPQHEKNQAVTGQEDETGQDAETSQPEDSSENDTNATNDNPNSDETVDLVQTSAVDAQEAEDANQDEINEDSS